MEPQDVVLGVLETMGGYEQERDRVISGRVGDGLEPDSRCQEAREIIPGGEEA